MHKTRAELFAASALFSAITILFCLAVYERMQAIVYFVPFSIESYDPTTRYNISKRAAERWNIRSRIKIERLLSLIRNDNTAKFSPDFVHAVITIRGRSMFVDQNGVVYENGHQAGVISINEFLAYRSSLSTDEKITRGHKAPFWW